MNGGRPNNNSKDIHYRSIEEDNESKINELGDKVSELRVFYFIGEGLWKDILKYLILLMNAISFKPNPKIWYYNFIILNIIAWSKI